VCRGIAVSRQDTQRAIRSKLERCQGLGTWHDGVWTIELSRKLNTGHVDDVQV